ncbi:MAG: hypothetical protein NW226_15495 [Microscillaceae bacterium]|nr:hypothetical protein [Microscillaceae bacterium]
MVQILDALLSSILLLTIAILLLSFAGILLAVARPFRSEIANGILSVISIGFVFGIIFWMLNARYYHALGKASEFTDLKVNQKYIFLVDKQFQGDSDGMGDNFFRLFTLDRLSGELIGRSFAGEYGEEGTIVMLHEDTAWVKTGKGLLGIKGTSNQVVFSDQKKALTLHFEEFKIGIDKINYLPGDSLLSITAKDGRTHLLSPRTQKLGPPKDYESNPVATAFFAKEFIELSKNQKVYLSSSSRKQFLSSLYTAEAKVLSPLEFLEGYFVAFSPEKQIFLILHYETTDKIDFILSAFSSQNLQKPLWDIYRKDLQIGDFFSKSESTLTCVQVYENEVYFTIDGFLCKADLQKGTIIWKKRL